MWTLAQRVARHHGRVTQHAVLRSSREAAGGAAASQSLQERLEWRGIATSPVLAKRRGGNSAFVTKSSQYKKKQSVKTKDKLKQHAAPHESHLERTRRLKSVAKQRQHNMQLWDQLEGDEQFNREIDEVAEYLNNLGPEADYIYEPEQTLADLDENDVLDKLNALARGERGMLEAVAASDAGVVDKQLQVEDYNFLIKVYAAKGMHKEANALLTRMERNLQTSNASPVFTPVTTDANTTSLALASSLDAAPHTIAPNALTYMYYICSLGATKQAAAAVRTLGRMKERGVVPDVQTYNSVMSVCAKANKLQWAYNIMEKMQLAGLVPDKASFTILMNAAIAEGDVDKAFETFHLMRSHVTDPDAVAFTTLIHGFAKIGRVERALNLMEEMLECGLTPTPVTFNSLINACAKSHHFAHKAVEFYYEMQELYDYLPDLYTYNTVLHACAKHGDYIQAEKIMGHMIKHQVPMDEVTYNTLLNVYARSQIKKVVEQAPRNKKPLPPAEPIHQEPLEWDEHGREIDLTRPFKDVHSMENWNYDGRFSEEDEDDDEEVDEDGFAADEEVGEEMTEDELKELEAIRQSDAESEFDFDPRPMDLENFGKHQSQNITRAERWFYEMTVEKGMAPSVVTLNSMLSVYANALRLRSAETFLREKFEQFDIEPTHFTYRTLMQMYVRANRTHEAESLMEEVKRQVEEGSVQKDAVTFGLLVDHYARQKQLRSALTTLEEADELGLQLSEKYYKKVRKLTEKFGIFTELIPEDPDAVIFAGTRASLMAKRKVRAEAIAYNQKVGKKFLLPKSV
ncbi:TPA: hypothetical protein N0F65_013049 [Lagenidium giganteum]|uniref:Pentacotripeptide-repeat region of PRORP domain-containing protein n=1 Tax=Lagenidium giganteum TaxID=4803 RepID=A0AAV2YRC9_9STRA|nr:TPA: hypothetical protein N0F65_013049 [Lagenidium giganteum]